MSARHSTHWHCVASDQLLWEHWEEESLLFDCRSGQTHSLTPLATEVILLLEQSKLSSNGIVEHLNTMFGELGTAVTVGDIAELLHHFDSLGLIEECPPQA